MGIVGHAFILALQVTVLPFMVVAMEMPIHPADARIVGMAAEESEYGEESASRGPCGTIRRIDDLGRR